MSKNIEVKILGDAEPLRRSLAGASRNVQGFEHDMGRASRGALSASGAFSHLGRSIAFASGAFLGAAGFTSVVKQSVEAAMSLEKELAKTRSIFGSNTKAVDTWSKTTAHGFGISRAEALKSANQFGQLFRVMGVGNTAALGMSKSLTELSAKLALFAGKSQEEAAAALAGGLTGRTRALKAYGIVIDQTTIKAEAMRLGMVQTTVSSRAVEEAQTKLAIAVAKAEAAHQKYAANTTQVASADLAVQKAHNAVAKAVGGVGVQLTAAQKAQAIYSLVQGQSTAASATWRKEQGSAEVQMKRLHAEIHDTEVTIGNALLPTVLKITTKMADWLGKTENQKKIQHDLNVVVKTAGTVLGALKDIVQTMAPLVQGLNRALGGTKHTFELLFALGIAAKLRAIAVALGVTEGVGIAGAASLAATRVAGLRLAIVSLFSASVLGGLGGLLGLLGKIAGFGFGGAKDQQHPGTLNGIPVLGNPKTVTVKGVKYVRGPDGVYRPASTSAGVGAGAVGSTVGAAQGITIGTGVASHATHETAGLPGYPAVDIMASAGSPVRTPEACTLSRRHFINWDIKQRIGGWTCYLLGHQTGSTYFVTHLGTCGGEGNYAKGAVFGTVASVPGGAWAPHVHVGQHTGGGAIPIGAPSTGSSGASSGGLTVGTSGGAKSTWKGATEATIIAAKASVTSMLTAANLVIGGMAGPMDAIERAAEMHLKKLREHLHPHMTASDLARTKADIAKWGKVLTDEIAAQTKEAKRAFDQASREMLRAFDKETAAGLKSRAAPDETPAEAALRQLQEAHDDAARQQALADAIAAGDAQAIADAEYAIQVAGLEKQAKEERKAADEKAAKDQADYQNQRDDQRIALQNQLDDWNEWLTKKKRSWNEFWAWVKANPNGGGAIPNIGETASAPGPGYTGGFTQVPPGGYTGGFVVVPPPGSGGGPPRMARGGIVRSPTMAVIGEGGPEAVIPLRALGGDTYHFHFPHYVGTRQELVEALHSGLLEKQRRGGKGSLGLS